jgi:tetratricopeptide (TPR) repeat protein
MNKKTLILLSTIVITSISSNAFSKSAQSYLNEGIKYLESNNLDKAEKSLKTAIKLNKNLYVAYSKLGNVYLERGDNNTAISYYNKSLKINPKYSSAYNNLGLAYINLEQFEKALGYFNQSLKLDPKDETVLNNIELLKLTIIDEKDKKAESFISDKEYDKALKIYQEFLKKDPNSSEYNSKIGLCYAKMSKFDEANNYLQKALKLDKENDIANFNMGNYYLELVNVIANPQENVEIIEKHINNAKSYFEKACYLGYELACDNRDLKTLRSSLNIGFTVQEREDIENLIKEGLDFYNKKKYVDSISFLEEAYNIDPSNKKIIRLLVKAKRDMGLELIKNGKTKEGNDLIKDAEFLSIFVTTDKYLEDKVFLFELSEKLDANNIDKVINSLENFKSEEEEIQEEKYKLLSMAYFAKSMNYINENEFTEAKIYLNKSDSILKELKNETQDIIELKLVNKISSRMLYVPSALKYLEDKKYNEAELELIKIIENEPNNFVAYANLGIVKSKLGKIDEGLKLVQKSIEIAPEDPFNYYNLAEICLDKNEKEVAVDNIKRMIQILPEFKYYIRTIKDPIIDKIRNMKEFKELIK